MIINVKLLIIALLSIFAIVVNGRGRGRGRHVGARGGFSFPSGSVPFIPRPRSG